MKVYLFYYLIEILKAEVCLKNIKTIYKTTFPGLLRDTRTTREVRLTVNARYNLFHKLDFYK